ncbi:MAG: hypothetical protein JO309_01650 [Pseudonocardiales bacterium]|nr:autoinducer synthase [Hyphomicrobiales bacterium]MBV8825526.1 autoinducer synthase [Hyphomicrobiales bacterium]MBV9429452.1 autoinducer synthase [Bradyrhizobiaceae bacterium]MBV9728120.1 hypothetical protein [Pseudonocardiales bacterium]
MSIACLSWETAHLHGEAWISHHRLRHRLFVDRQNWRVPTYNGLEYDRFDTPAARYILWLDRFGQARGVARLLPTTEPYMIETLWPDLVDGPLPRSHAVWEATRFGCDCFLDPQARRRIVAELICGCLEFAIAQGISRYIAAMPLGIFERVIRAAGCPVAILGPTRRMERLNVAAAYVDASAEILAGVRARTRVDRPVLEPPAPARPVTAGLVVNGLAA